MIHFIETLFHMDSFTILQICLIQKVFPQKPNLKTYCKDLLEEYFKVLSRYHVFSKKLQAIHIEINLLDK